MRNWGILFALFITSRAFGFEINSVRDLQVWSFLSGSSSIEKLVSSLPKEMRDRAIFIHESHSLQDASITQPRVLLFSHDGNLSFTVATKGKGKDEIEAIEFLPKKQKFNFYRLEYKGPVLWADFSNKKTCTHCHGNDLRPNWEPHPRWPGVFGSHHESPVFSEKEVADYSEFLKIKNKDPIYKVLRSPVKEQGLDALADTNVLYTKLISQKNFQRIARLLKGTREYSRFKYALFTSLACSIEVYPLLLFPDSWRPYGIRNLTMGFPLIVDLDFKHQLLEWYASHSGLQVSKLSMVFDVSLAAQNGLGYWSRYSNGGSPEAELAYWIAKDDPDFLNWVLLQPLSSFRYSSPRVSSLSYKSCLNLAEKSKQELQFVDLNKFFMKSESETLTLKAFGYKLVEQKCMSCHDGSDPDVSMLLNQDGILKWKNQKQNYMKILSKRLDRQSNPRYRMPRFDLPLEDNEITAIKAYIESIK